MHAAKSFLLSWGGKRIPDCSCSFSCPDVHGIAYPFLFWTWKRRQVINGGLYELICRVCRKEKDSLLGAERGLEEAELMSRTTGIAQEAGRRGVILAAWHSFYLLVPRHQYLSSALWRTLLRAMAVGVCQKAIIALHTEKEAPFRSVCLALVVVWSDTETGDGGLPQRVQMPLKPEARLIDTHIEISVDLCQNRI